MLRAVAVLVVLTACRAPAPTTPPPAGPRGGVVALISASAEWKIITAQLAGDARQQSPYGEWLVHHMGGEDVIFFHGGYGKVAAAGSTQYAIDRWQPRLLVNLGTAGGFGSARKVGDIILASETVIYDIVELMGDPDEAIADYRTRLDTTRWPAGLADRVVVGPIVSADRDLDPAAVAGLAARFHADAGDWETGAIAWVAARTHTPVLILRGITDIVTAAGDVTYHAPGAWERASQAVMASLVALLGEALPDLRAAR